MKKLLLPFLMFSSCTVFGQVHTNKVTNPYINPATVTTNSSDIAGLKISTISLQGNKLNISSGAIIADMNTRLIATQKSTDTIRWIILGQNKDGNVATAGDHYKWYGSSAGWGAKEDTTVWNSINFYVPGNMFNTNGLWYSGKREYGIVLASATVSVTQDGTVPAGKNLNFDIKHSSGSFPFQSIFKSTTSLRILIGATSGESTDFAITTLTSQDRLRFDCTEVGTAGGNPVVGNLTGRQQ